MRRHPLLRVLVGLTLLNCAATALMAAGGLLPWEAGGYLVLLSILTWFFGVTLPMMNRAVREHMGAEPVGYWGSVVELFARVVICVQTGLHTSLLVWQGFGLDW